MAKVQRCKICGCTDKQACASGGCFWVAPNLCSRCVSKQYDGGKGYDFVGSLYGVPAVIPSEVRERIRHMFSTLSHGDYSKVRVVIEQIRIEPIKKAAITKKKKA